MECINSEMNCVVVLGTLLFFLLEVKRSLKVDMIVFLYDMNLGVLYFADLPSSLFLLAKKHKAIVPFL